MGGWLLNYYERWHISVFGRPLSLCPHPLAAVPVARGPAKAVSIFSAAAILLDTELPFFLRAGCSELLGGHIQSFKLNA
jgi:hypothetical protein